MTDPQLEILRNEIRDGFRASLQRDNALSQKVDTLQEGVADLQFAINSLMASLLRPAESDAIRSRMAKTPRDTDAQADAR